MRISDWSSDVCSSDLKAPARKDDMVSESTEFKGGAEAKESAAAFGDRVRSAVIWRSGSQILAQLVTWSVTLVVIRMLDPADSGMFAMTQVIMTFLAFITGWGFASVLFQSASIDSIWLRQVSG